MIVWSQVATLRGKAELKTLGFIFMVMAVGMGGCTSNGDVGADGISVPASIAADCSVDSTDQLNTWLRTIPDGVTISFAKGGCYQLDRTLEIVGRNGLTFKGNGARLVRKTSTPPYLLSGNRTNTTRSHNQHIRIEDSRNITLRDLEVVGMNTHTDLDPANPRDRTVFEPEKFGARYPPGQYGETGLLIEGSSVVTVTDFRTDGTWGDGISLGHDNAPISTNVTLRDVTIDRNGRQGVSFTSIRNALLDNVRVLHSHATGFDLEPNGAKSTVKGVEIRNSYANAYTVAFSLAGANSISEVNIHDNIVQYTLPSYPWFNGPNEASIGQEREGWRVANNIVRVSTQGIKVWYVRDVAIEGNDQHSSRGLIKGEIRPGVNLKNVEGAVSITNNQLIGATIAYNAERSSADITACNNKLAEQGNFDQPSVCQ